MKIELTFNYNLELHDCKLDNLVFAFKQLIPALLSAFIAAVLRQFAERLLGNTAVSGPSGEEQPFNCSRCGAQTLIWKTRASRTVTTKLTTCMGSATVPQMQVQCKKCGRKEYIVRRLLDMPAYSRMSERTEHQLALCGSLTSFRVGEVFARVYGASHSRSTIWRCLQKVGKLMSFSISPKERGVGQADGTGIPIRGIAKRGKELKVLIQENKPATAKMTGSRWRLAGIDLGNYNGSWANLFRSSLEAIKSFKSFVLTTDGDEGIRKGLGNLIIHLQRCLWHIPHQLKHCLWADGVARTSGLWKAIMARVHQLIAVRHLLDDDEIEALIEMKNGELDDLVDYCRTNGCEKSASYLENAKPDMFTALRNRLKGKATSQVERVMRTVNLRINYGKWSISGALNAMKVRLAFYYNGYDPSRYKPSASGSLSGGGDEDADGKKT